MTPTYTAIIEGRSREITGMDADGKYLLAGGEKLWIKSFGKLKIARARKLIKVSKLTFTAGEWMLEGENVKSRYVDATIKRHENSGAARTEAQTMFRLIEVLNGLSDQDRAKINGVVWCDEGYDDVPAETAEMCAVMNDDLADFGSHVKRRPLPPAKNFLPVLLTDFSISRQPTPPKAKREQEAIKARQPKRTARFENEFTVAVIPQKNGKEKPLAIEPELRGMIMKILSAGGKMSRTKLREGKSDSWQPDRLLLSKNAKQLIKARLLGARKSGRTTAYWAKQQA